MRIVLEDLSRDEWDAAAEVIRKVWLDGGQILVLGNGGSAATAQHLVGDWMIAAKNAPARKPFWGHALPSNLAVTTAYANDISFEEALAAELEHVVAAGDLIVLISGSGNSPNLVRAMEKAQEIGCRTLAVTGFTGGKLKEGADSSLWMKVSDMQIVQDLHMMFGHSVMGLIQETEG